MRRVVILLGAWLVGTAMAGPPAMHPDTDQAARILGLPDSAEQPLASGRVQLALPANRYVYLHLQTAQGDVWIAGPRGEGGWQQGQVARYGPGRVMRNWYSKKLQRHFAEILFVGELRRGGEAL